jgi:HSP20 family protein
MPAHDTQEKSKLPATTANRSVFADNFFEPFSRLRSEFDRVFEDTSLRSLSSDLNRRFHALAGPALEFKDKDKEYELVAEVPGMKAEEIQVKVAEGVLRLSGERKEEREEKDKGFLFSERRYGHFERSIQLPAGVDEDKISASANDGLLTIHLPKTEDSRAREKMIPVQSA